MNIVILGPQGSGKGTQAELIAEKYNLEHIETGKICREIASSDHPLSKEIKKVMLEGKLVSDNVLGVILGEILKKSKKNGFVFDGTPRNIEQYNLINKLLYEKGTRIDKVVLINISEGETIKRLSSRRICEKCGKIYNLITKPSPNGNFCKCGGLLVQREDDTPESIKKRLQTYHEQTSQVISLAEADGTLFCVDGERPVDEIFNDIVNSIDNLNGKDSIKD